MSRVDKNRKRISQFRSVKKRNHFRSRSGNLSIPLGCRNNCMRTRHGNHSLEGVDMVGLARIVRREKKRSA